ncbi:TonB-dependent receptor [Sphingomonas sp. CGMCC 1.13654]|uniref:TonB-dependent receptor n=1 Tax=Sphingomonas chungangi TaxID=2683589 RepID=A0A838L695_9SPHN|nr:TonB-dependent receptor [Sphingomonas chungangi]
MTAERRAGTVQSTPLSITAVSGAQLQAQGITNVSQLAAEVPGISQRNAGPGQTEFEIRGISSAGGSSPTVGFYLDDVPLTAPVQGLEGKVVIDPNVYDLNRVEVLRGPQGTLYGASSMGGTIRLLTNQPDTKDFAASGEVVGSTTKSGKAGYAVNAMVNIPLISDTLALRVTGSNSYTSGWIDRVVVSPFPQETDGGFARGDVLSAPEVKRYKNVNWEKLSGVRGSLLWTPTENLTVTPTIFYQKIRQGGPNYADQPPGIAYEAHYQPFDVSEPYSDRFTLMTLPIVYKLGDVNLTSVTGYYKRRSILNQDSSEVAQDFMEALIGIPDVSYDDAGALTAYEHDRSRQITQELRLSSAGSSPFQWVIGGFYQDFKAKTEINTTTPGPIVAETFGVPSYFFLNFTNTIKQYAAFGEASYKLGDFKLTAGVRYYHYKTGEDLTEGGGLVVGPGAPIVESLPSSHSGANPKVNLSYQPSHNLTIYAQASKGFRPGGGNAPPPVTCPNFPTSFAPDSLWSYELGEKARLFDNRLTVNSAVYHEVWSGIQQQLTLACGDTYTANAGTAHITGGELEATLHLTNQLTLTTGFSYTDAKLSSVLPGTGFYKGERIQNVPKWTNTATLVYSLPIDDTYTAVFRATDEYTGGTIDPNFAPVNHIPSRNLINLRLGVTSRNRFTAFIFANNVTDKRAYIGDPEEIFTFVPSFNRATTNQPRTIGIDLTYAIGGPK